MQSRVLRFVCERSGRKWWKWYITVIQLLKTSWMHSPHAQTTFPSTIRPPQKLQSPPNPRIFPRTTQRPSDQRPNVTLFPTPSHEDTHPTVNMHLMYTLDNQGKRVYTLKKVQGAEVTKSAHPARFSPDDKYSR